MIIANNEEHCIKSIKAIGQNLIDRAEDICNDLDKVSSITIYANINPDNVVNFDVTKNYLASLKNDTE